MLNTAIFDRPIGVWLVFLWASYNALVSTRNVVAAFINTPLIDETTALVTPYIIWGILFALLGFWQMVELWVNGSRQKMAVLSNLAATSLMYLTMISAAVLAGNNPAIWSILAVWMLVGLIWFAAYVYLKKIGR